LRNAAILLLLVVALLFFLDRSLRRSAGLDAAPVAAPTATPPRPAGVRRSFQEPTPEPGGVSFAASGGGFSGATEEL
jgi:hypothetical protein